MRANPDNSPSSDKWTCQRKDGRDLIRDWKADKEEMSPGRNAVVLNKQELDNVDPAKTDYLFGKLIYSVS